MATVNTQKITALGPIKMEIVYLTDTTDEDTFTTVIQNPKFCLASETNTANANSTVQATVTTGTKTVTVSNQTAGAGVGKVAVLVFGF